jgi:hypothetical protein
MYGVNFMQYREHLLLPDLELNGKVTAKRSPAETYYMRW